MSEPTRRPQLPPAHEPLHEDVSYLGNLLGQVLREQQGQELFDRVETVRHASIRRRTEGTPLDSLAELVAGLPLESANPLVQAFSVYFSLTNLAEQVHRIRRRRDYQLAGTLQPGSLDAVFDALAGADPQAVATALRDLCIFPVLTAHPTEATRRTILKKEQRIARALVDRLEQTRRTPHEDQRITQRIRSEIGLIWQTAPQATMRPSVADEVEHVLFFLTEVVYRIVAPFHEAMEEASARLPGVVYTASRPLLCFGSWVGGDMDGNPNAGAETLTAALGRQRQMILGRYRAQVRGLFEYLSHSGERASFNPDVPARVAAYRELFPNAAIPERYGDMPYRVLLWQIWHRLGLTESDAPGGYSHAAEMIHDLEVIERSLLENRGARAGRVPVRRLLLQVRTFGFHLATLDVRQDGRVHQDVVEELLGIAGYAAMPQSERTRHLEAALSRAPEAPVRPSPEAARALAVFRAIRDAQTRHGHEAIGLFIISMAQGPDDVLAVLYLARLAGLVDDSDAVPLDIAPLFETVDDLERAEQTFQSMVRHPRYRRHLDARRGRQTVMLGYSDSAKISGVGASRWALYRAQENLVAAAEASDVELRLFHGRGGTIARGGSKPRSAILAAPRGASRGFLRTTEQGEIINSKYGLRGIAERTLELTAGAVLETRVREPARQPVPQAWRDAMATLATASRRAWDALVHDDPRFIPFFRSATPIDAIERMALGSRPASRRSGGGVENLRAIPWVFAWSQNRLTLPGWYGLGRGLGDALERHGEACLRDMASGWPFFANLLDDASMTLAKADIDIAARYAALAEDTGLFEDLSQAFYETRGHVLTIRGETGLLDSEPLLREIIRLRNPYVDPMSLIQVDLLRRWREGGREDVRLEAALFETVRGIARGLRNTG